MSSCPVCFLVCTQTFAPLLSEYLNRLSMIVDNKLNCGPVLTWMEVRYDKRKDET